MLELQGVCPKPGCGADLKQVRVCESPEIWSPRICGSCGEKDQQERERRSRVDLRRGVERAIQTAGLPRKHLRELSSVQWDPEQVQALSIGDRFLKGPIPGEPFWLFFEGQSGPGKTLLACELARRYAELHGGGRSILFTTTADMITRIKGTYSGTGDEAEIIGRWQTCSLLILDDFGAESATAHTTEKLMAILDARYRDERLTLFTSNYGFEGLVNHFAADPLAASRIFDRMDEVTEWVRFTGKSRRVKA